MRLDRRSLLLSAAGAALLAACGCAGPASGAVARERWSAVKAAYLSPEGRIVDTGNGGVSHSEGQGYGMLLAAAAGDEPAFTAMEEWTRQHLARGDVALHSWRYDPASPTPVSDPNNATDGDILIAAALLLAGRQWDRPACLERSVQIRAAILEHLAVERHGLEVLLPGLVGFDVDGLTTLNPAYYVWPALDAFRKEDGEEAWGRLIRDGEAILDRALVGPLSLPPDWVEVLPGGHVRPAEGRPPRFGFEAVRVPLYLALSGRTEQTAPFARFWRSYLERDMAIPAWIDLRTSETAPYPLSNGALEIVARVTGASVAAQQDRARQEDYYSAILGALAALPSLD